MIFANSYLRKIKVLYSQHSNTLILYINILVHMKRTRGLVLKKRTIL